MANFLLALLYLFLGSFWIRSAIVDFKKEKLFYFGTDIMLAIWIATNMVYHIIMGLMA